jgi:hypothetical protein
MEGAGEIEEKEIDKSVVNRDIINDGGLLTQYRNKRHKSSNNKVH